MGVLALYGSIVDEIGSILEANANSSDRGYLVPSVMCISHQIFCHSRKFKPTTPANVHRDFPVRWVAPPHLSLCFDDEV